MKKETIEAELFLCSRDISKEKIQKQIQPKILSWEKEQLKARRDPILWHGKNGPIWWAHQDALPARTSHHGKLETSDQVWIRNCVGSVFLQAQAMQLGVLRIHFLGFPEQSCQFVSAAVAMARYTYRASQKKQASSQTIEVEFLRDGKPFKSDWVEAGESRARAVNLARHLVNSPPNLMQPDHFEKLVREVLGGKSKLFTYKGLQTKCKIEVWKGSKLQKERLNLLRAVGQGSTSEPRLLVLKYKPRGKNSKQTKPIALVGKGITFDTGGLDIKPSSNMRLMKKDMGGAAAVLGAFFWAVENEIPIPLNCYLALAENSVGAAAFRPSDVYVARSGMEVEIHNTDAEGRLVLADALDVAVKEKEAPQCVIDVATLTGAIKVALGADIAGLFSNEDQLSGSLEKAATESGDLVWRMPLFSKYTSGMSTPFADIVNCVDGFGGAITAALFLEKFVNGTPWAHVDIYAWNDKATGPLGFAGGSGQGVQLLIEFLQGWR